MSGHPVYLYEFARGRLIKADDFSDTVKLYTLLGHYMRDRYHERYYAKAQNLARVLTRAYDDALHLADLLVMPTTPMKATSLPPEDASHEEKFLGTGEANVNTTPFNIWASSYGGSLWPVRWIPCKSDVGRQEREGRNRLACRLHV